MGSFVNFVQLSSKSCFKLQNAFIRFDSSFASGPQKSVLKLKNSPDLSSGSDSLSFFYRNGLSFAKRTKSLKMLLQHKYKEP